MANVPAVAVLNLYAFPIEGRFGVGFCLAPALIRLPLTAIGASS